MSPPLPYFKVNICPFPLPHFASIFFTYLWSFRWPNYIVTLSRYFSLRLPHLNIPTGLPLRGDDHDGFATHGRSREFRMHMKNPAQTGSGCIRFNNLKIKQATFADILVQFVWGEPVPLPVCAGFFKCIRNSLDRPCVTMPSWSSPLKCKVSF
jgi:hypothetical protein